jgi:hypothetical protein
VQEILLNIMSHSGNPEVCNSRDKPPTFASHAETPVESLLTEKAAVEEAPKVEEKMMGKNKDTAGADTVTDSESMTSAYEQDLIESEVKILSNILSHTGNPEVCNSRGKPQTDEITVELKKESKEAEKVLALEDGSKSKEGSGKGLASLPTRTISKKMATKSLPRWWHSQKLQYQLLQQRCRTDRVG